MFINYLSVGYRQNTSVSVLAFNMISCPVGQVKALVSVIKHGNICSSNRLRKKYSTHTYHSKYQMCYNLSYLIQKLLILFLFVI